MNRNLAAAPYGRSIPRSYSIRLFLAIFAVLLLIMNGVVPVAAAPNAAPLTFTVNTTDDSVDATPGNGICADSSNRCSLRAAVMEANAHPDADTISIPAGIYQITLAGVDDNASKGDLDVTEAIIISGAGSGSTFIQAGTDPTNGIDKLFSFNPVGSFPGFSVTLENLTIRYGKNREPNTSWSCMGGALDFDAGSDAAGHLTVRNTVIRENSTTDCDGGGIALFNGGTVLIENCSILNNVANVVTPDRYVNGGGLSVGSTSNPASITISGSTIASNTAATLGGGIDSWIPITINQGSIINDNLSLSNRGGGGLHLHHSGTSQINETTISGNRSTGGPGGGILLSGGLELHYSRIVNNQSSSGGKGLHVGDGSANATNNWWGCSTGPGAAPCDTVTGTATTSPFLRDQLTAASTPLATNQSTALTVSFLTNSAGTAIPAGNLGRVIGQAITWDATGGTLSGTESTLPADGTASGNFQATAAGSARISAKVDNDATSGAGSNVLNLTINKANTTTTITNAAALSSTSSAIGEPVTVSVSVAGQYGNTPTAPTGTVTVSDGTVSCIVTLPATSCDIVFTTSGNKTITATYNGNANFNASPASAGASHTVDLPPAVTINQAVGQADPASSSPINFTVVFSELVTGFTTGDVNLNASTAPGTLTGTVTEIAPTNGTTYNVAVSGMTGDGTVIATINAGVAFDLASQSNNASTSTDNSVTYNRPVATVTLGNLNQVYDGTPKSVTATTNPAGLSVTFTYNGSSTPPTDAGNYAVVATVNDPNYQGSASGTLEIGQVPLTVTANNASKAYGAPLPAFTVSYSGFLAGENQSVLGGTLAFTTPATVSSGVGTYAITLSGLTSTNYAITFVDGTLTINPAPLTITADSKIKLYGAALPTLTASYSGFVLGQDPSVLGGTLSITTPATASSSIGTYALTPSSLTSSNYAITFVDGTLTVNPAPLTITADNKTKLYGAALPAFTASYSGFVLGQDPSVLGGGLNLTTSANSSSSAGTYAITPSGLTSTNYAITFVDGTLTVDPAWLVVTADNKTKLYGVALPAFTASYGGFVLGQDPSVLGGALSFTTPATASSGVGTYAITPSGLTSSNYAITFVNGTLTVDPAPLTITADDKTKLYGAALPVLTASYSGFVPGQDPSVLGGTLSFTTPATASSDVGTYALTPSGLTSTNYAITFKDGTLTVNPAPLTITADSKSKLYGVALPTLTASYSGFVLGQDPSVLGGALGLTTPATASSNAGTYAITPSGLTSTNYAITFVDGTLTITQATATVTLSDLNQAYDGTPKSAIATTDPAGLSVTFTYDGLPTLPTNVGSYAVVATVSDPNYQGSANGTLHITAANTTTTITADVPDPSVVGQAVTFNYTVSPVPAGSGTPTGNVTVSNGTQSCTATVAAGSCSITFTTPGTSNFIATYTGDTNFAGSTSAVTPHTVNKANTMTTITSDTPDPSLIGQSVTVNFTVTPVAPGAGTPSGNVTVSAGADWCTGTVAVGSCTITFTSLGAKTLTAMYAGDTNFNPSTSATATHTVTTASTTTTITSDALDPSISGAAVNVAYTVTVVAPGTGTPTGNVTVSDGTDSCTGTVAAGSCSLILTTPGMRTLTAVYTGDTDFSGSTSPGEPHTVQRSPAFTSADNVIFTVGAARSFAISTSGYPNAAITYTSLPALPASISFTPNANGTATLSGTPVAGDNGTYIISLTADNDVEPNATQALTLQIAQSPAITSAGNITFVAGNPGTFTVTTTGNPTPSLSSTGALPSGVTFTDNANGTATLSGTPALNSAGTYNLDFTASNGTPSNATQNFTLTVDGPPGVSRINSVADTGDTQLIENEHTSAAITQLLVIFNKDMNAADAQAAANYSLIAGASTPVVINTIVYSNVTHTATLSINGGTALANGKYTLTVKGAIKDTLNAPIGTDFVRVFFIDNGAPHNTSVITLPDNSTITNGATVNIHFSSIDIIFDEDVNNPSGNSDPDDVTNPQNYLLLSPGPNGAFDTLSCAAGVAPDDVKVPTGPVTYSNHSGNGPFVATVQLNNGSALENGSYKLFICGTTSIVDLAGNALNNNLDQTVTFNVLVTNAVRRNPQTGFAPNVVTVLPEQPAEKAYADLGDLWIEIPTLKLKTSITGVPLESDGWDVTWLNRQVGWLEGTAYPTWEGNTVLTAHGYTADGNAGPFAALKDLKYGENVVIHLGGMKYTYAVRTNSTINPNNTYWLTKHEDLDWITLITCQQYDEKTKSYRYRRVVRAVLINVEKE